MPATSAETVIAAMPVRVAQSGRVPSDYDLRAFLHRGGAALRPLDTHSDVARRRLGRPMVGRLPLVAALHASFQSARQRGASDRSRGNLLFALRSFWTFCDKQGITLGALSPPPVRDALAAWVLRLWERVRRMEIVERSAGAFAWGVAGLLAEALDVSTFELAGRITMPRINSGAQNPKHDKMDLAQIDGFIADMDDIIASLSIDAVRGAWPIPIVFRSGATIRYNGHGRPVAPPGKRLRFKPREIRRHTQRAADASFASRRLPITLRTQAECLRFMGLTGMNVQPALDLRVDDVRLQSFADQYKVHGLKNRKGDVVTVRIPKSFRAAFERWLAFRSEAFPPGMAKRLFPLVGSDGIERSIAGERGFGQVARLLAEAQRPRVPASLLRYARAQKLVRLAAIGGDLRKVAGDLQDALPTLMRSYLRGSQAMAVVEFSRFIVTITPEAARHRVRNGGDCERPNAPERIEIAAGTVPAPDCVNPAGCLFCVHYRGIENLDYLHSILSYKEFLRLRAGTSTLESGTWRTIIRPTMERIDDHVDRIAACSEAMHAAAGQARERVREGAFHARWVGWIEMLTEPA